jgi:hypothetical protein
MKCVRDFQTQSAVRDPEFVRNDSEIFVAGSIPDEVTENFSVT